MTKYLIVGLGNIGMEYVNTRHNIGFDVADAFAYVHKADFSSGRLADIAQFRLMGRQVIIIKPTTYMNLSGRAVKYWLDKEAISVENSMTIVDDLALPLSRIRIRATGTHAGHNGLRSIQEALGTDAYPKLRFGIGNDFPKGRQVDFVLSRWKPQEEPVVRQKIDKCVTILESFILAGMERTMNEYNKLEFTV